MILLTTVSQADIQKPKAVSLESPVESPLLFQINKVDFHAHYRLRGELARTMSQAEAETETYSLISLGQPGPPASLSHPTVLLLLRHGSL